MLIGTIRTLLVFWALLWAAGSPLVAFALGQYRWPALAVAGLLWLASANRLVNGRRCRCGF